MDEFVGHYHKQNNPGREQQISHGNSYMWNLKRKKKIKLRFGEQINVS